MTLRANGSGTGSVTASRGNLSNRGGGTTSTFPFVFSYIEDDVVTLTPTADASSVFMGWSGTGSGSPVRTVTMDDSYPVWATFSLRYDVVITDVVVDENAGTATFKVGVSPAIDPLDTININYPLIIYF